LPRDGALTLSDVRGPLAIVCEPCGGRGRDGVTRLAEQHADAKLTNLLLMLYVGAGSCFSLRTADLLFACQIMPRLGKGART
jgi:hypothetical protein